MLRHDGATPLHGRPLAARRVVSTPVVVTSVVLAFAAGLGLAALADRPEPVQEVVGDGLGLLTPPPTPAPAVDEDLGPEEKDETGLSRSDREAGILEARTPRRADGELLRVPGASEAPGTGEIVRVRLEVESGLPVDGGPLAETVMGTLNDARGWGGQGTMTFARTEDEADLRLVLASPVLLEELCGPARPDEVGCGREGMAVVSFTAWVEGSEEFGSRAEFRRFLVNHVVGHVLGKQHVACPGPGEPAPVMQQQTQKIAPCEPNAWPFPDADGAREEED